MGQNMCCQGREDKMESQIIRQQNGKNSVTTYGQKSYVVKKPDLTFGEQLIDEIKYLNDYDFHPIDSDWKNISSNQNVKIFVYEWQKSDTSIINVIRTEFILKCSIEKYINQNADKLKEINKKIEDYRIVEDVPEYNESIRYISYKGMLLFPGRDFIYFKKSHQTDDHYFEGVKSIEDERIPLEKKKTRGTINLMGQSVKQIEEDQISVRQFIDVDLKMNVPLKNMGKQIQRELQQYYDNLFKCI